MRIAIAYFAWLLSLLGLFWLNAGGNGLVALLASFTILGVLTRWMARTE